MAIQNINVGLVANDGTGDSIRDAFVKTNDNFIFLDTARLNIVTGNLTAQGNIKLDATADSYWTGTIYLNGVEIATVNNLFSGGTVSGATSFTSTAESTSTVTGAVTISGGLGVAKNAHFNDFFADTGTLTGAFSAASVSGVQGSFGAEVATGDLTTTGNNQTTGNLTAANVSSFKGSFTQISGILQTNAQPFVTSVGTLSSLIISGNLTVGNIVTSSWGNITAANATVAGLTTTANLRVRANAVIVGNVIAGNIVSNIGTFSNITVSSVPTNKSVTNKDYVNTTVVAFAIGLGS